MRPVASSAATRGTPHNAVIERLTAFADLTPEDLSCVERALAATTKVAARRTIVEKGEHMVAPLALVSGWAARIQTLMDGRRQILQIWLPGDVIGQFDQCRNPAPIAIQCLTPVEFARLDTAPPADSALARALTIGAAQVEFHLLNQVTRLGRLSAYERVANLLLELRDRLALAGCSNGRRFAFPLTQEVLADVIGLTSVHLNRTLQLLRREGAIEMERGEFTILGPDLLESVSEYIPSPVVKRRRAEANPERRPFDVGWIG